jgi:nickel-dependent lactate racemase
MKISSFIQANTIPHEYVYFFPNEAAYYFFFDRHNPTRYAAVYHAITREHRLELVADLEKKKPRFVVYSMTTARIDGISENIQAPEVVEYLHKEYNLYLDLKDIRILKRIRS